MGMTADELLQRQRRRILSGGSATEVDAAGVALFELERPTSDTAFMLERLVVTRIAAAATALTELATLYVGGADAVGNIRDWVSIPPTANVQRVSDGLWLVVAVADESSGIYIAPQQEIQLVFENGTAGDVVTVAAQARVLGTSPGAQRRGGEYLDLASAPGTF